jgi:hypothetical protein
MARIKAQKMAKAKKPHRVKKNNKLPYVAVATLCEKVLREGETPTLVRIIDTLNVTGDSPKMPPGVIVVTIFVLLKSGEARGHRDIRIVGRDPNGEILLNHTEDGQFGDPESGSIVQIQAKLVVKMAGLYWFDVNVSGTTVTRIPMRLQYKSGD